MRFAEAVALHVAQILDGARVAALTRELEALVDNMDDAVNVRDLHGRIVLANAASRAMLHAGGPDDRLDLPELWDRFALFAADGRDLHDEDLPWFRLLHGAEHVEPLLMRRVVRATGEQQWLLVKATAIRDGAGRPVLVMSVTEDVTATRRAEIGQRLLLDAGLALSRSLDVEASLQEVAELVVPALADWCGIDLPGRTGVLEAVAVAHADPERAARARELRTRHPVALDGRVRARRGAPHGRAAAGRRHHGRDAPRGGDGRRAPRAAARDRPHGAARACPSAPGSASSACW